MTHALQQAGYDVIENTDSNQKDVDLILTVKINKFWSWMQVGFASVKINSEIETDITNTKAPTHLSVYSKVTKAVGVANGQKWIDNIDHLLDDYETKLEVALPKQ